MDIQTVAAGVVGAVAITGSFWAAGKFGPGLVVKKLDALFHAAKDSAWIRDPAKPHRARLLLAAAEFLEEEIPDKGEGQEVYDALGAEISGYVHFGSPAQWAKVTRQFGDAVDTELDEDIKELGAPPTPPAA